MSVKIKGRYVGDLRCELIHDSSSNLIHTDAPIDNHGKGETFSPTDLVAAALGACMLTIIAIRAKSKKIEIDQPKFFIEKEMSSSPRRISEVNIIIEFQAKINMEDRTYLEHEAKNCPVALSLNTNLIQNITFKYI